MGLGKQAKTLSKGQVEAVLGYLAKTRHAARNRVIFAMAPQYCALTWFIVVRGCTSSSSSSV